MPDQLYQSDTIAPPSLNTFVRRALVFMLLMALAAPIWFTAKVLLLAFAAVLLAVFLDFLTGKLAGATHMRRGWAFTIVTVGIALLLALAGWIAVPHLADQVSYFVHSLPQTFERIHAYLQGRTWGRTALKCLPNVLAFSGLAGLVLVKMLYLHEEPEHHE